MISIQKEGNVISKMCSTKYWITQLLRLGHHQDQLFDFYFFILNNYDRNKSRRLQRNENKLGAFHKEDTTYWKDYKHR